MALNARKRLWDVVFHLSSKKILVLAILVV